MDQGREKVGFVGVGTIGKPMALNILKGGHPLTVFDLNQAAVGEMIEAGAKGAPTPAEVARQSEVVITMVPDAPDVEKAALGPGGIIEGLAPGAIYIDMSTSAPATTRKIGAAMAAEGIRMVDAPVARTVDNAYAGTLAIMMGGDPADVDAVRPILERMGDTFTYCGPLGNAHAMKLVNNFISGGTVAVMSEALAFGVKAGLALETITQLVGSTFARNGILEHVLPAHAFKGDYAPGFMARLSHKDIRLALDLAAEAGLDAPVGKAIFETLQRTLDAGYATDDFTSMIRVNEARAGVQVRLEGHQDGD
jgi:3-hydroxyisobutyrate dehydrogenase-like beta-hydroxyacid dehydrogenase